MLTSLIQGQVSSKLSKVSALVGLSLKSSPCQNPTPTPADCPRIV